MSHRCDAMAAQHFLGCRMNAVLACPVQSLAFLSPFLFVLYIAPEVWGHSNERCGWQGRACYKECINAWHTAHQHTCAPAHVRLRTHAHVELHAALPSGVHCGHAKCLLVSASSTHTAHAAPATWGAHPCGPAHAHPIPHTRVRNCCARAHASPHRSDYSDAHSRHCGGCWICKIVSCA